MNREDQCRLYDSGAEAGDREGSDHDAAPRDTVVIMQVDVRVRPIAQDLNSVLKS